MGNTNHKKRIDPRYSRSVSRSCLLWDVLTLRCISSTFFLDFIKTVYQMFNYEVKWEPDVVALNNEISIFQVKKPSPNINLALGLLKDRFGLWCLWCITPPRTIFQLYRGVSFTGGENRSNGENHLPFVSHWQTLSQNVISSKPPQERSSNLHPKWW